MCDPNSPNKSCSGKCAGKGKCCKAFLTVKGKEPEGAQPPAEKPDAPKRKCCGGCKPS